MKNKSLLVPLFCLGLVLAGGCVTEEIVVSNANQARLIVTRVGTEMHISWLSQKGQTYTLMYTDALNASSQWMPVEGAVNLRGTGTNIEWTDHLSPGGNRYYRLQLGMLK